MEGVCSAHVQARNKHSPAVRREGEMNKRKISSFALGVMLIALGFPAEAQRPTKVPRIGYLSNTDNSGFFIKQKRN
jgi:hypothetical protein